MGKEGVGNAEEVEEMGEDKTTWEEVADEVGFEFIEGKGLKTDRVTGALHGWKINLETFINATQNSAIIFTKMTARYKVKEDFAFKVFKKGLFSKLGERMGLKKNGCGVAELDQKFKIHGNDTEKLHALFSQPSIRKILEEQDRIILVTNENKGIPGQRLPKGMKQLYFQEKGVLSDKMRLVKLIYLFGEILNRMQEMDLIQQEERE